MPTTGDAIGKPGAARKRRKTGKRGATVDEGGMTATGDEKSAAVAEGMGAGSIEQVREILFGAQQREMSGRFGQMERAVERVARDADERMASMQQSFERRIEELRTTLEGRLDSLTERVDESLAAMRKEIAANGKAVNERLAETERGLRSDMELAARQAQARIDAVRSDADEAARRLEDEKTGRAELGAYLLELGMRLSGDGATPPAGKADGPTTRK